MPRSMLSLLPLFAFAPSDSSDPAGGGSAPPAPLPPALASAPPPPPSSPTQLSEADQTAIADKVTANLATLLARAQPAARDDAPRPRTFAPPSANLGRPVFVWTPSSAEPMFAFITREYLDDKHPDYVDLVAFPVGEAPRPYLSVPRMGTPGDHAMFYQHM